MVVVEGEVYCSDSDSDSDDDVGRFVFLARQPAPAAGRHAEDDRGASSANDDGDGDGDATADEEESERGGGRRKRRDLREILDDAQPPPPPPKKARVELIAIAQPLGRTPPSGSESETESDSAPLPCEGSHGKAAAAHEHRARGRGGESKNAIRKKRGACGKRGRGPGCEEDGDRESRGALAAAAEAGASPAATSAGRFLCNLCERCFDSHQALGGHVLGHRKKAKIAIAAAASLDDDVDEAGGIGNYKDETSVVEANEETASGTAQADKMAAVAARRGKANGGGGGCHGKIKTVADVAEHRKGVDSRGHEHVNGDADLVNKGNALSGDDFTNDNSTTHDKTAIVGAAIPNQKVVAGTCHGGADGDGNARTTTYKCKVCGAECLTGRALGGHMRKHRKRPPLGGGGEGRSPSPATDDDCQIPLARMFGAEAGLQRENKIGLV